MVQIGLLENIINTQNGSHVQDPQVDQEVAAVGLHPTIHDIQCAYDQPFMDLCSFPKVKESFSFTTLDHS